MITLKNIPPYIRPRPRPAPVEPAAPVTETGKQTTHFAYKEDYIAWVGAASNTVVEPGVAIIPDGYEFRITRFDYEYHCAYNDGALQANLSVKSGVAYNKNLLDRKLFYVQKIKENFVKILSKDVDIIVPPGSYLNLYAYYASTVAVNSVFVFHQMVSGYLVPSSRPAETPVIPTAVEFGNILNAGAL